MDGMVKATVTAEHRNGYGTKELKAVGDTYRLPHAMALQLKAQELISLEAKKPAAKA